MFIRLANLVCIVVVAFHALLPTGFMLAPEGRDGSMTVVICTGYGPHTVTLDAEGNPIPAEQTKSKSSLCDYATVGTVAVHSSEPVLLWAQARYAAITYKVAVNQFRLTKTPGAISARGPPVQFAAQVTS